MKVLMSMAFFEGTKQERNRIVKKIQQLGSVYEKIQTPVIKMGT